MKFRIVYLGNDRTYWTKKADPTKGEIMHNQGLYVLNPEFVKTWIEKEGSGGEEVDYIRGSEIFYFENQASPIPQEKPGEEEADPSSKYLDDFIYINALEQTGDPAILGALTKVGNFLKPVASPGGFIKLVIYGLIAWAIIRGSLGL